MNINRHRNFSSEKCNQNKYNTNNDTGKMNHLQIFQEICKQNKRNEGSKENRHIGTAHVLRTVLMLGALYATCEITLRVAQIVNIEQLQHYIQ